MITTSWATSSAPLLLRPRSTTTYISYHILQGILSISDFINLRNSSEVDGGGGGGGGEKDVKEGNYAEEWGIVTPSTN